MDSQNTNTDNSNSQVTDGTNISEQGDNSQLVGFAVEPKLDCPHFDKLSVIQLKELFEGMTQEILKQPCQVCNHVGENWVCLSCSELYCSRYINMDMSKHVGKYNDHCVGFSLSDGSFWCYQCDSYISNIIIKELQVVFSDMKHGKDEEENKNQADKDIDVIEIAEKLRDLLLLQDQEKQITPSDFTYEELISGLKEIPQGKEVNDGNEKYNNRQFKNVVFMTGAGISVSAGIPDFRTPGSGLYSQLQKYNLPYPEAIFEINYFKKNPQAFYTLSKEFLTCGSHFTSSHYFIAQTNVKNRLLMNFSQNIDGLEIDAGLPEEKLVQAHGHFRTAKCTNCQTVADIHQFYEAAKTDQIHYCSTCKKGIVKPDIVFFGESLPPRFFSQLDILKNADLVFVMGTSLKVYPFAALVEMINENVPIVLVNRENPGIKRRRFLFLEGEIDDNVEKIMTDIGWDFPEIKRTYPAGTIIDDKKKQNL